MNFSNFRFTLDLHSLHSQTSIPAMLGDTGITWHINLCDGGKPYLISNGALAKISIKRPTGTYHEMFCEIRENSTIVYHFEQETCAVVGLHNCEITLYGVSGAVLGTPRFSMVVSDRVIKNDEINLSDHDHTIVDAMAVEEAKRQVAEANRAEVFEQTLGELKENFRNSAIHIGPEAPENGETVWLDTSEEPSGPSDGQADLAENDPNAAGYVKNRTHYSEWVDTVLFPEQTITISGNQYMAPGLMGFVVGETYTVVWEGVSYTCVAENNVVAGMNVPCVAIGNPVFVGGANNGMPFAAADVSGGGVSGFMAMADGNYTVSVLGKKEIVHQLDAKYSNEFMVSVTDAGTNYTCMNTVEEIGAAIEEGKRVYIFVCSYISNGDAEWKRYDLVHAIYGSTYEIDNVPYKQGTFVFAGDTFDWDKGRWDRMVFVLTTNIDNKTLLGAPLSVANKTI